MEIYQLSLHDACDFLLKNIYTGWISDSAKSEDTWTCFLLFEGVLY